MMIRRAAREDAPGIAEMAVKMWREHTISDLAKEFEEIVGDPESAVFLSLDGGEAVGFAQCSLRHDYVEGTDSSPVGYLEGIFVEEGHRHSGHARELLEACEGWAKEKGCSEFASDCELENSGSLAFHLKAGFEEAGRVICFVKPL